MAAEEQTPRTKPSTGNSKKRKKPRKDKWGQPIIDAGDRPAVEPEPEPEPEPVPAPAAAAAAEEEEEEAGIYETGKVVASGLPYTTTEAEIRELFERFGPLRSLQLSRFPDSGNFRGLAFVSFESNEVAMKSLELDGFKIGNRFMRVERCRLAAGSKRKRTVEFQTDPKKADGCLSAYVGNLKWDVTETDLRDFFKSLKISSIRFAINKRTGDSRGFCHVDFEDDESLEKAVGMNQSELRGRPIKISYAVSNRG
ncbi:phragmoplastin interacting protein 1-like [Oryza glaberrima]|uniref:RRM domain-containing protein n=2 Tax=Oryza TaxID=4527 RepID=A0A0D3FD63_9ORYZ|nr:phragmoplastin interacting protein 1-like [Oryza glaberrima]